METEGAGMSLQNKAVMKLKVDKANTFISGEVTIELSEPMIRQSDVLLELEQLKKKRFCRVHQATGNCEKDRQACIYAVQLTDIDEVMGK